MQLEPTREVAKVLQTKDVQVAYEHAGTYVVSTDPKAFGEYNEKNGVTDAVAKIGAPWSVDVEGDRAYVVAPATYTYKQHGKVGKELHAVFTAGFRKTDAGWRISAWTWSKH